MKVLLINGSPHAQGCTYTALSEVAAALEADGVNTELWQIGQMDVRGCIACHRCRELGKCVFDDAVNQAQEKLRLCDGLIVGSPVYYASANATLTAFLDRLFFSCGAMLAHKPAAAVVSARRAGTTATLDQLNKYFMLSQMPVVSSQYWNMVHGNSAQEVLQDQEGLQIMRTLGHNMAWLLRCMEAGKAAGVPLPPQEERVGTNFIR
ncbi:MAG: flavodoxin family protein [Eubacteriales bacterium]|nr:flavodoxin family protein [Eubacteriales bacterium]